MKKVISGIQQIGIGNRDVHRLWKWYRQHFGMDIRIFEEAAEAPLMTRYTGGEVHSRNAALAMNMQGGGGFEIWQFTSREAQAPPFTTHLGDLGIYITKLKARNVEATYRQFQKDRLDLCGTVHKGPDGKPHFYLKDPDGNLFEICEANDWFGKTSSPTGGIYGAVIGVSNMEKSLKLYQEVLDYDRVVYDRTGTFEDLEDLNGGKAAFRRVLLEHSRARKGAFSKLLGASQIELIQREDGGGRKLFHHRYWGDMGYIHLCFDVRNMDTLQKECTAAGFPFTIDSANSFDMGKAAGRFAYIEDPDGTWIEFVETHKLPVVEKWNWFMDIRNRQAEKPLPNWMLKALKFNRIKD
ncbi:MAG: glyoxalase [Owenweeksia sp.]|nr:glyoxalase [Owenweeksia sp.]MBF98155.1 glyoxalase [Owenweeksia sp.]HCQ15573.1 glyoxalase [Cryomorphaceae bacterium]|tara:strand:+ start:2446 stop:3504 length:1059 start_codon:yes stop_codon:yes gene_type:complete